jgi:hypothetical protein
MQQDFGFPLAATATPVGVNVERIPFIGLTGKALI